MATARLEKALAYTSMLTTQKWYAMRVCRLYLTAQPLHTVTFLADEFSNWNKRVIEFYMYVSHDGSVLWNFPVLMRSACRVSVRYFPFDQQVWSLVAAAR